MTDFDYMKLAIAEAERAAARGEVPVGAVLVGRDGDVLSACGNEKEEYKNPLRHAEMKVIAEGVKKRGKYLTDCTLYVTLEPCPMCAGAMVNARLSRLVFGAYDQKAGAAGTVLNVTENSVLNHRVRTTGGVMETECAALLSCFFKARRAEKSAKKED